MKLVIQRVTNAKVSLADGAYNNIGSGLLVLVGFSKEDTENVFLEKNLNKLLELRIFADESGRFNLSAKDLNLEILLVPQFTLFANCSNGRRPDFIFAMEPEKAKQYFDRFASELNAIHPEKVKTGFFGQHMQVELNNDGPVTIILELN